MRSVMIMIFRKMTTTVLKKRVTVEKLEITKVQLAEDARAQSMYLVPNPPSEQV